MVSFLLCHSPLSQPNSNAATASSRVPWSKEGEGVMAARSDKTSVSVAIDVALNSASDPTTVRSVLSMAS